MNQKKRSLIDSGKSKRPANVFAAIFKIRLIKNFENPIFYISALIFSIFTGVIFFIRQNFFTSGSTNLLLYFSSVPYICIILLPFLCYKKSSALYDSFIPLKYSQLLLADFFSLFIQFSIMVFLLIPACLLTLLFGTPDFGQIFVSIFCLILYGASIIALCLFVQELIPSSITAFLVSALALALFNSSHLFAVYVSLPHFLSFIFRNLSFAWHFDSAGKGIIDTRDLVYFVCLTSFFIYLTVRIHEVKKGEKITTKIVLNKFILILILLLLNSTKYYFRFDFSRNKVFSLSRYSKELLANADENVKITYFRSSSLLRFYPQIRDISDFLNSYSSASKNVTYVVRDPDSSLEISNLLQNYGIASQQLRSAKKNSTEYLEVYSAIVIEYRGNAEVIPFLMSADTLEYDLDGRLKHLLSGNNRIINIFIGNGMNIDSDYSYLIPWLNSQGFICNVLQNSIELEDCTGPLFVIGDSALSFEDAARIERYILDEKGNAFFAVSPFSFNMEDWSASRNINTNVVEVLENWGVIFEDKISADISCSRISMYADSSSDSLFMNNPTVEEINYPLWIHILPQQNVKAGMTVFWAVPLRLKKNASAYAVTSPSSWYYEAGRGATPDIETNPFILRDNLLAQTDFDRGSLVVCAEIKGALEGLFNAQNSDNSHIIVLSDPLFVNTLMTGYNNSDDYGDYRNFDFLSNVLLRLNGEEDLAALQSRIYKDTSFFKIADYGQLNACRRIVYIVIFGVIPFVILFTFAVFFIRKRKAYEIR